MKPFLLGALLGAAVATGVLIFLTPRPPPVERLVEDTAARERVRELTAQLERANKRTRKATVIVRRADGSKETRINEETVTETVKEARASTETRKETASSRTVTAARPDWRVGILAGGTLTPPLLPLTGPLAVGVLVERRILGPLSLGLWGLSSGQAGVALTVEF